MDELGTIVYRTRASHNDGDILCIVLAVEAESCARPDVNVNSVATN